MKSGESWTSCRRTTYDNYWSVPEKTTSVASCMVKQSRSQAMPFPGTSRTFGYLPDGHPIQAWTLFGSGGMVLESITYGGAVTRLMVPDREGHLDDVVLGFSNLGSYLICRGYLGAIVGRVAGRITGGRFDLEGETLLLARNDGPNHLHGGVEGFDKKIWTASSMLSPHGEPSLSLTYHSCDGEEGYPGNVDVAVTYTVTHSNALLVETEAVTDAPTPFSLTMHHYFNLAGEGAGSIADHELQIDSDEFVLTDEQMTLLGQVGAVSGRGNDFRQPRRLGDAIPYLFKNHGDLYLVSQVARNSLSSEPAAAARLVHPASGRALEVYTSESHLQLYTGAGLDGSLAGISGKPYVRYAGVCLECQGYPDGTHSRSLSDIILRPASPHRQTTKCAFSTLH
jgi:aldose 1-epimerase